MEVMQLGSFSVFINIAQQELCLLTDSLEREITKKVTDKISKVLSTTFKDHKILITNIEVKRGCLIIIISVGAVIKVIVASGVIGGAYKVITDYDKIKKNLKLISDDIKGWFMKIKHKKKGNEAIPSEYEIELYDRTPDKLKKLHSSGQEIVILSEKEITTEHKISIMGENFLEELKETKKEKITKIILHKKS